MKRAILLLAALAACDPRGATGAPEYRASDFAVAEAAPDLLLRTHDVSLESAALLAADQILEASGLRVEINGDGIGAWNEAQAFFSDDGLEPGYWGFAHVAEPGGWIAIHGTLERAENVDILNAVVLHEVLHLLGAEHVEQDRGVMSPNMCGAPCRQISALDLEALCAQADCSWIQEDLRHGE